MRLLFIRHAEPDYATDSLTEKGRREAELLAKAAPSLRMDHCFVSPLGRAGITADYCMKEIGKTAQVMPWLEEFDAPLDLNRAPHLLVAYPNIKPISEDHDLSLSSPKSRNMDLLRADTGEIKEGGSAAKSPGGSAEKMQGGFAERSREVSAEKNKDLADPAEENKADLTKLYRPRIPWDIGQRYYAEHPELADPVRWRESEIYLRSQMPVRYDEVTGAFDELLASFGYVHENGYYRVERENTQTLAFFCHLGISCVLLSRIWNCSPFFLWQNLAMMTSTVTELVSEEREQGIALFRAQRIGDQSHLYAGGEKPSFFARYCEVYSDFSEETGRH